METPHRPITVLAVDDHPIVREGIAALLEHQPDMVLIAEAENAREAIDAFRVHRPDVTLMDLQMPGASGIEAIVTIRREFPRARIAVLTTYRGDAQAARALEAGAAGYLLKSAVRKELLETIRAIHAGYKRIPADVALDIAEHHTADPLTPREIEILRYVAGGGGNKIVADALGISLETVKGHMKNVLAKLEARDRTHAVTVALKRGILDDTSAI
jgi:DNA-binding NarL/FixJ family response regulator